MERTIEYYELNNIPATFEKKGILDLLYLSTVFYNDIVYNVQIDRYEPKFVWQGKTIDIVTCYVGDNPGADLTFYTKDYKEGFDGVEVEKAFKKWLLQ